MLKLNPVTRKRLDRFKQLRRGYWSAIALACLFVLSLGAEMIASQRALLVIYEGEWHFPTYGAIIPGTQFGLDYQYETDYKTLTNSKVQHHRRTPGRYARLTRILVSVLRRYFGSNLVIIINLNHEQNPTNTHLNLLSF